MYYIHSYYDGYQSSDVADYFRINTGITQGDTSSVVEMNLFLALTNYGKNVAFTTVWNQGHTEAERSGDAEDNFISWIAGIEGVSDSSSDSSSSTSTTTTTTNTGDDSSSSSSTSSYDYSSYSSTSTNTNLSGQTIESSTSGESAVYITNSGITIADSAITKSGDISSSNTEDSEFYGINAAILVQGGGLTMTGGNITTSARGGNALVATNGGTVTISGTTVTSTGSASARGLHATYGGTITATNVTVSSTGGSCANLATDRGEGTVSCTNCQLSTAGAGSPLIYSTGDITVTNTTGTASAAQAVVVEGKNSATVKSSELKCTASPNKKNDECGVLIYQSQSGDADTGTSSFTGEDSTLEILESSSYYSSAPMFYVTNTAANIALTNCKLNYGSGKFLVADEGSWGSSGSNGGTVTLTLTNQNIEGNISVGNSSSLTLSLVNSTIKGTINGNQTAAKLAITLDSDSTITLTGNSYYTSLTNADSDSSNIVTGSYTWGSYEESSTSGSSSGSGDSPPDQSGGSDRQGGPGDRSDFVPGSGGPPDQSSGSDRQPGDRSDFVPGSGEPPDKPGNDTTITTTYETNTTVEVTIPQENNATTTESSVVLLGFSHFNTSKNTSFSFYIYFVPILNFIFSPRLRFPLLISYSSLLRSLDEVDGNCSLGITSSSKVQYSCEVEADTKKIENIEIKPNFNFSNQGNVSLAGITPLANSFMNKLQDVGNNFDNLTNSTVYKLDHSIYNKYSTYLFNISGVIDNQPTFGTDTNFILQINTNSSGTKNSNCTITEVTGSNYTLNCKANENFDPDLQSSYGFVGNDILLVNFDTIKETTNDNSTESTSQNGVRFRNKGSSGLNSGAIVAIVICPIVALGAAFAFAYFLKGGSAKKPMVEQTTNNAFNSQVYSNQV